MSVDNTTHLSMNDKEFRYQVNEYLILREAENTRKRKTTIVVTGGCFLGCLLFLSIWFVLNEYLQTALLVGIMTTSYCFAIKYNGNSKISTWWMISGYLFFGLSLFQINQMFHMGMLNNIYLMWGVIGVFLVLLTKNGYLSIINILIMNLGAIQVGIEDGFSYLLFGLSMVSSFLFLQQGFSKIANIVISITMLFQLTFLGFKLEYGISFFSISCLFVYWMTSLNGWNIRNEAVRKTIIGYSIVQQVLFVLFTEWYSTMFSLSWKQSLFVLLLFIALTGLMILTKNNEGKNPEDIALFLPFCLLGGFASTLSIIVITFYCLTKFRKKEYASSKEINVAALWLATSPFLLLFTKIAILFMSFPVYLAFVLLVFLALFLSIEASKELLFHTLMRKSTRVKESEG